MQIVKAIDALSREQLVQITSLVGIRNAAPVFSMVPLRPAALLPTITEEDRVILNNVQKVVQFLTAGTSSSTIDQVSSLSKIHRPSLGTKFVKLGFRLHYSELSIFSCIHASLSSS